ncbi:hypothetical protein EMMF5_000318 [Cystobasidiomycetes sp. EMM_F5]
MVTTPRGAQPSEPDSEASDTSDSDSATGSTSPDQDEADEDESGSEDNQAHAKRGRLGEDLVKAADKRGKSSDKSSDGTSGQDSSDLEEVLNRVLRRPSNKAKPEARTSEDKRRGPAISADKTSKAAIHLTHVDKSRSVGIKPSNSHTRTSGSKSARSDEARPPAHASSDTEPEHEQGGVAQTRRSVGKTTTAATYKPKNKPEKGHESDSTFAFPDSEPGSETSKDARQAQKPPQSHTRRSASDRKRAQVEGDQSPKATSTKNGRHVDTKKRSAKTVDTAKTSHSSSDLRSQTKRRLSGAQAVELAGSTPRRSNGRKGQLPNDTLNDSPSKRDLKGKRRAVFAEEVDMVDIRDDSDETGSTEKQEKKRNKPSFSNKQRQPMKTADGPRMKGEEIVAAYPGAVSPLSGIPLFSAVHEERPASSSAVSPNRVSLHQLALTPGSVKADETLRVSPGGHATPLAETVRHDGQSLR